MECCVAMCRSRAGMCMFFFFQAEDGIRDYKVTGVQTCALPICLAPARRGTCAMLPSEVCSPGADHTPQVIWAAISTSAQPQVRGGDERLDRVAGLLERGPTSFLSVHDGQDAEDPSALGGDCGNGLRCRLPGRDHVLH